MERVAVIGAGPGGLAAARWLRECGFDPWIYESHSALGGQWNNANPLSGIWPQMRTNTYIATTQFSDLDHPPGTAIFPRNGEILDHLEAYARQFDLLASASFDTTFRALEHSDDGYRLTFATREGDKEVEADRVVIATGRYNKPKIPPIAGLDGFTGRLGVLHAHRYKSPDMFRGARVLVAGGAISALEIASDLAMLGAQSVHLAQRRQRYVMPKMVRGVPFEYYGFTYAQAARTPEPDMEKARNDLRRFALRYGGDPARYGAPAPASDTLAAGFTGSQHYLNLVAEDRIRPVPWITSIAGETVSFADGTSIQADAIIFGTGFDLNLPFLSDPMRDVLEADDRGLTLADFTTHPGLPNLAFVGMFAQNGGYITVLEQQARYLAYLWSGLVARTPGQFAQALAEARRERQTDYQDQHMMALRFARLCGTDPAGQVDEDLLATVRASATTPLIYRLAGPHALPGAEARFRASFDRYGPIPDRETADEHP